MKTPNPFTSRPREHRTHTLRRRGPVGDQTLRIDDPGCVLVIPFGEDPAEADLLWEGEFDDPEFDTPQWRTPGSKQGSKRGGRR